MVLSNTSKEVSLKHTKCLEKCSKSDKKSYFLGKRPDETFPWIPGFPICSMSKNEIPKIPKIHRGLPKSKKHLLLRVVIARILLKSDEFVIQVPFWL